MNAMKNMVLCFILLCGALVLVAQNNPVWQNAVGAGGTGDDAGVSIAIDSQGNQYITGMFYSTATFGNVTLTAIGDEWPDIFVAKLDPSGNWLWAVRAGGTSGDKGSDIALDGLGNACVTGEFRGTATFGDFSITGSEVRDIFVAKLDPDGNWLWVAEAGGAFYDVGYGISVDGAGNIYVIGCFEGTANFGILSLTGIGNQDIFAAKLDSSGNWLWAVKAGGEVNDVGSAILVDGLGFAYVTGLIEGIANFGPHELTSGGGEDIFVARLDPEGNWLWAVKAGGTGWDRGIGIAIDGVGNAYVTGDFAEIATFGSETLTAIGEQNLFVAKLDPSGNWIWALKAGGTNWIRGVNISVDGAGYAYVTGEFSVTANFGIHSLTAEGANDIFVAKLDPDGNWIWAVKAGGTGWDNGYGTAVDETGFVFVTGSFEDTAMFSSHSLTAGGRTDIFIAKLGTGTFVEVDHAQEARTKMYDAWPNPMGRSESALIKADIGEGSSGTLSIFNLRGQMVACHVLGQGIHEISFDGSDLPAGIYLYSLQCGTYIETKKLVLLK